MTTDSNGDVILAGRFFGSIDLGGPTLNSDASHDVFVVKIAGSSGAHMWSGRYGATSYEAALAVVTDGTDDVYITGGFTGDTNLGGSTLVSAGNSDIFLLKLNGVDGAHIWSKRAGGLNNDFGYAVAVGVDGHPVIGGTFIGLVDFGGGSLDSTSQDMYFAKYSGLDGSYLVARSFGSPSGDGVAGVAVDSTNSVILTGYINGDIDFGGGVLAGTATAQDAFVAKFSAAGVYTWARRFGGATFDRGTAVGVGAADEVYATGSFEGAVDFGGTPLNSAVGSRDGYVQKIAATDGTTEWARRVGGLQEDSVASLAVANGSLFIVGEFRGLSDFLTDSLMSAGGSDGFCMSLVP